MMIIKTNNHNSFEIIYNCVLKFKDMVRVREEFFSHI